MGFGHIVPWMQTLASQGRICQVLSNPVQVREDGHPVRKSEWVGSHFSSEMGAGKKSVCAYVFKSSILSVVRVLLL